MTKQRQRERARQRQHAAQQASHRGDSVGEGATLLDADTLQYVEEVFRWTAEHSAMPSGLSVEDTLDGLWTLYENGFMRLVRDHADAGGVGLMPCGQTEAERQRQAAKNRPLVEFRRQQMAADRQRLGEEAVEFLKKG